MNGQEHKLKNLIKCPVCRTNYDYAQAVVLRKENSNTIFHITCGKCETAVLSFVSDGTHGIVSINLATDLNKQESKKLFDSNVIQVDNILDVYEKIG